MTTKKRISVTAEPREEFTVDLVGKEYIATEPKGSLGLAFSRNMKENEQDPAKMSAALNDYVTALFGAKQAKDIMKRLESPTDDLDFPHIMKMIELMIDEASGENPTT